MKKMFFLTALTLTLATQVSCQKEVLEDAETLDIFLSEYDYEKIKVIFNSLPETGFNSENYEIANLDGSNKQKLPVSKKALGIYKFSPLLLTKERREEIASWKTLSEMSFVPFWFLDSSVNNVKFQEFNVVNIYLKGELIFNENIGMNALFMSGDKINHLGTSPLILKSAAINDRHELLIKTYPYDHWARSAGTYLDGKILFTYIPKEGAVPLFATDIKVWEEKFLIELKSYDYSSDSTSTAILIVDPKTKELDHYKLVIKPNKPTNLPSCYLRTR